MAGTRVCPECGGKLPADAPGGLCPGCLMMAGFAGTDRGSTAGASTASSSGPDSVGSTELDRFKQSLIELGLVRARELDLIMTGAIGGVPGLARALVRSGKLTPYQAAALSRGKGRGLVIGNYFILDKLGAGGMGVVFKARHRRLGRVVALKILPPSLARDAGLVGRFRREVDVAARLDHPNVVAVLDADEDRGVPFMTMEFIEGNDLDRLVRDRGPLPVDLALDCLIQAARGLEAAHAQGIVHRDIKPGNLMLDARGTVRVLDLGLARLVEAANPFGQPTTGRLTRSGTYMGTVDFMAPEQGVDSSRVDHRADVYSLGCTLCYLLTGRAPFEGSNTLARLMAHQDLPPPSLSSRRPEVPRPVEAVYQELMAKRPDDRPATMTEVIRRLEACWPSAGRPERARSGLESLASSLVREPAAPTEPYPRPSPIAATAIVPRAAAGRKAGPSRPTRIGGRASAAMAVGAMALLAVAAGGYAFRPKSRPASDAPGPPVATGAKSAAVAGGSIVPARSPIPVRASKTFDVMTLTTMLGWWDHEAGITSISVDEDGRRALLTSWAEECLLIRTSDGKRAGKELGRLGGSSGWMGGWPHAAMSANGERGLVVTRTVGKGALERTKAREAGILWFWDLANARELFPRCQPYDGDIRAVAISADGQLGLTAGEGGALILWELKKGVPSRPLGQQAGGVTDHGLAFFPDGQRAASVGRDRRVHIWDIKAARERAAWEGQDRPIVSLAISRDGHRVATAGDDGMVILWDADRDQAELHRFKMPPRNHGAEVAFDPEGNLIAAGHGAEGSPDTPGDLIAWDARTFAELRRDENPFVRHISVATLPDGKVLTGDRYAVRLWTPRTSADDPTPNPSDRSSGPVDLLGLIGPSTYKVGDWQPIDGGGWGISAEGANRFQIPYDPPPEYRVEMIVERTPSDSGYAIGFAFPVGGRLAEFTVDRTWTDEHWKHWLLTGLTNLDGVPTARSPGVHRGRLFKDARPTRIELTVGRNSILLTCDGTRVLDWVGNPQRFIPSARWNVPDSTRPFIASTGTVKIRRLVLTPSTAGH